MTTFKVFLLVVGLLLGGYLFVLIHKSRHNFSEYVRFPVALDAGQMTSFVIGILLYIVFPYKFIVICAINIWIGVFIGILFCSTQNSQSVGAGFFCGGHASIMGTMVGAAAINPTLCGLPLTRLPIQNPGIVVGVFGVVLLGVTAMLVRYSSKCDA
jgi:hypothetical protein